MFLYVAPRRNGVKMAKWRKNGVEESANLQMEKEHYYVGKAQNEHGLYKRAVLIFL